MPPLPADARIGEVSLTVSDLDRSLAFYTDVLGFQVIVRAGNDASLGAGGPSPLVRLTAREGAVPRPRRTSGLYHFAILVPDRAALGRSLRRLAERQWPLTGASDHLVSEALYLDDPDGLGIEIYRDRPRETWQHEGGEVLMATAPLDLNDVGAEPGADLPWTGLAAGTVIGHVHLHVPDLARAEAFYCDGVGFSPMLRRYPGALFVAAGGYHHHLGLNVWAGLGAPPPPVNAVGLQGFTIEASGPPRRDELDEATGVTVTVRASLGDAAAADE
ncbi:MAG: VOC family protein [Acidobacteria bacterium]|nr:VOC family protein [Acidobacteriota bacterium]